ncbi:MAG: helicase-related protein, partial [Acidimicrobiales bacterium]
LLISKTLGIEGRKLLSPDDDYEALRDFNASYEGQPTTQEELYLEFQRLLDEHPELEERLAGLPCGVFSGKEVAQRGTAGVFFCFRLPAFDTAAETFTLKAGVTKWYLQPLPDGQPIDEPGAIADAIRSVPDTPRVCVRERALLTSIRDLVLKHIKNTYLKQIDAPIGAPKPQLVCWMELNSLS